MKSKIQRHLFALQDSMYKDFQAKLMPTIPAEKIIGVRTPILRLYAKELAETADAEQFLQTLPHSYYEENNLHAILVERIRDYDKALAAVSAFLPFVNNWATCDSFAPKVFKKHPDELLPQIRQWLKSEKTYTVRYGLGALQRYFLDENFRDEILELASSVHSDEYYIQMMQAWFFATALAKHPEDTDRYFQTTLLDEPVRKMAVRKALESFRIPETTKTRLRRLKL